MGRFFAALVAVLGVLGTVAISNATVADAATPAFTASAVTTPATGAELFYDDDNGVGEVTVDGTVTGAGPGSKGDLVCYSPQAAPAELLGNIDVSSGSFAVDAGTGAAYGEACELVMVPDHGGTYPGENDPGIPSGLSSFTGPAVSISDLLPHSANGNLYGYFIESGTLQWSFGLQSLGECPVSSSFVTDPSTLYFVQLFDGDACLPARSGIAPDLQSRSALQVDGLNAYPPGAIAPPPQHSPAGTPDNDLTSVPGFEPIQYTPAFGPNHASVIISETDTPTICSAPGTFPPSPSTCPALNDSGIVVNQTTALLSGGQVTRVEQHFMNVDTRAHTIDLLFSQSVDAPETGELPGFEFPGQETVAAHTEPDSFSEFPPGPGSIVVIGDSDAPPSSANPIGAITYSQPPLSADFISTSSTVNPDSLLPRSTFTMHYVDRLAPGATVTYGWSYSQATNTTNLGQLEQVERDRFSVPSITIVAPGNHSVLRHPRVEVRGTISDPVGFRSVTVDGQPAPLGPAGSYTGFATLKRGRQQIVAIVTNLAGITGQATADVTYTPKPCTVPALGGDKLVTARNRLRAADCTPGKVFRVPSHRVRKGRVVRTAPPAGSRHNAFAKVRLYVSRGTGKRKR
jgi:hypothetical protein